MDDHDITQYRHYRGNLYTHICDAYLESDPKRLMVVYRAVINGKLWCRPALEFYGMHKGQVRYQRIERE